MLASDIRTHPPHKRPYGKHRHDKRGHHAFRKAQKCVPSTRLTHNSSMGGKPPHTDGPSLCVPRNWKAPLPYMLWNKSQECRKGTEAQRAYVNP